MSKWGYRKGLQCEDRLDGARDGELLAMDGI